MTVYMFYQLVGIGERRRGKNEYNIVYTERERAKKKKKKCEGKEIHLAVGGAVRGEKRTKAHSKSV